MSCQYGETVLTGHGVRSQCSIVERHGDWLNGLRHKRRTMTAKRSRRDDDTGVATKGGNSRQLGPERASNGPVVSNGPDRRSRWGDVEASPEIAG